jgi:metal-responsive CopG/Arc/MetJ family transcriptional regulator
MKRTTITLPNDLLEKLQKTVKARNKTRAVIVAIEGELRRRKIQTIKEMAGELEFQTEADELRYGDHRLG